MDHDAQLEDELRCRFQEGLQEAEHGDVSALKHQPPVEMATGPVAVPTALGAQVEGVDVPEVKTDIGLISFYTFLLIVEGIFKVGIA